MVKAIWKWCESMWKYVKVMWKWCETMRKWCESDVKVMWKRDCQCIPAFHIFAFRGILVEFSADISTFSMEFITTIVGNLTLPKTHEENPWERQRERAREWERTHGRESETEWERQLSDRVTKWERTRDWESVGATGAQKMLMATVEIVINDSFTLFHSLALTHAYSLALSVSSSHSLCHSLTRSPCRFPTVSHFRTHNTPCEGAFRPLHSGP